MKKIFTLICLVGMMQSGFGKNTIHGSYHNYTQNISDSINFTSQIILNVVANYGDSIVFTAYVFDALNTHYPPQRWFFNSDSIPNLGGQENISIIINQSGTYAASFWTTLYNLVLFNVTNTTGIPSIKNINFLNVYPSAVTSNITIQLNSLKTNDVEISFFDMNGRELKTDFYKNVLGEFIKNENTEALAKGIYFLRIKTGEDVAEKKFVKL